MCLSGCLDEHHHGGVRGVHRCASAPGRRGQREESEGAGRAAQTAAGKGSRAGEIQTGSQKTAGRGVAHIVQHSAICLSQQDDESKAGRRD